jgi:hypothetical protein
VNITGGGELPNANATGYWNGYSNAPQQNQQSANAGPPQTQHAVNHVTDCCPFCSECEPRQKCEYYKTHGGSSPFRHSEYLGRNNQDQNHGQNSQNRNNPDSNGNSNRNQNAGTNGGGGWNNGVGNSNSNNGNWGNSGNGNNQNPNQDRPNTNFNSSGWTTGNDNSGWATNTNHDNNNTNNTGWASGGNGDGWGDMSNNNSNESNNNNWNDGWGDSNNNGNGGSGNNGNRTNFNCGNGNNSNSGPWNKGNNNNSNSGGGGNQGNSWVQSQGSGNGGMSNPDGGQEQKRSTGSPFVRDLNLLVAEEQQVEDANQVERKASQAKSTGNVNVNAPFASSGKKQKSHVRSSEKRGQWTTSRDQAQGASAREVIRDPWAAAESANKDKGQLSAGSRTENGTKNVQQTAYNDEW